MSRVTRNNLKEYHKYIIDMRSIFVFLVFFKFTLGDIFTTKNGQILQNNNPITIKGINWFGFELYNVYCIQGLDYISLTDGLTFLKSNGFNAIRLPFSPQTLYLTTYPQYTIDFVKNPTLMGKSTLQILDQFVQECEQMGILILFDLQTLGVGNSTNTSNLPFNTQFTIQQVASVWQSLVSRYNNSPNILGADTFNEANPVTWDVLVGYTEFLGNAILSSNPNILIFATGASQDTMSYSLWGEDFVGVNIYPLQLNIENKVIYSAHVYGPSVFNSSEFFSPNFPNNLPSIWDKFFGFISKMNLGTLVIGEWGSLVDTTLELTWLNAIVQYFNNNNIKNTFWWCYNPLSQGTGGIVENDWVTPNYVKLNYISQVSTGSPITFSNSTITTLSSPTISPPPPSISPPSPITLASPPAVTQSPLSVATMSPLLSISPTISPSATQLSKSTAVALTSWTQGIASLYGGDIGTSAATSFGATIGSCGYGIIPITTYPFLSIGALATTSNEYKNSPMEGCGSCYQISCINNSTLFPNKCNDDWQTESITIMITDSCPECDENQFDLQAQSFGRIAPEVNGRIAILYRRVTCTPEGNIQVIISGNNPNAWLRVFITNIAGSASIMKVFVRSSNNNNSSWQSMMNIFGASWEIYTQPPQPSDLLIITDDNQTTILYSIITNGTEGLLESNQQIEYIPSIWNYPSLSNFNPNVQLGSTSQTVIPYQNSIYYSSECSCLCDYCLNLSKSYTSVPVPSYTPRITVSAPNYNIDMSAPAPNYSGVDLWHMCGGDNGNNMQTRTCLQGSCQRLNDYYWQCR